MEWTGSATAYLDGQPAEEDEEEERAASEGASEGGEAGGEADAVPVPAPAASGWRSWGGGALSALSGLQLESVQRLAAEALQTVRRDVSEFSEALHADAKDLAVAGAGAVEDALPELRATAAGLQETLEVVGGGIESAGASLFANIAQVCVFVCAVPLPGRLLRGRRARGEAGVPCRRACACGACGGGWAVALLPRHVRPFAARCVAPLSRRSACQVRDTIIAENDANTRRRGRGAAGAGKGGGSAAPAPPSLDALIAAMQRDSATYCDEPPDAAAFAAFRAAFSLQARARTRRGAATRASEPSSFFLTLPCVAPPCAPARAGA
jgi:hypothetical protein